MTLSFDPRAIMTPGGIGQGVGNILGSLAGIPLQYQQAQAAAAKQSVDQTKQMFDMQMATDQNNRAQQNSDMNAAQVGQNMGFAAEDQPLKTAGMSAHNALTNAQTAGELTADQKMQMGQEKNAAAGGARFIAKGDPLLPGVITIIDRTTGEIHQVRDPLHTLPAEAAAPAPGVAPAPTPGAQSGKVLGGANVQSVSNPIQVPPGAGTPGGQAASVMGPPPTPTPNVMGKPAVDKSQPQSLNTPGNPRGGANPLPTQVNKEARIQELTKKVTDGVSSEAEEAELESLLPKQ